MCHIGYGSITDIFVVHFQELENLKLLINYKWFESCLVKGLHNVDCDWKICFVLMYNAVHENFYFIFVVHLTVHWHLKTDRNL